MKDEQILTSYYLGDKGAFNDLVRLFAPIIRKYCSGFYIQGVLQPDLYQEGCIGLYVALQKYESSKGDFKPFAQIHIKNRIINAVKAATRKKHLMLSESSSLDKEVEARQLFEMIPSECPTPEEVLILRENEDERKRYILKIMESFTPMERKVFRHFLHGVSYKEVARQAGIPLKSVDNAYRRIKKKITKFKQSYENIVQHSG
ncbi:sigma-70 family RNA polymerase sigma factor [Cohnella sp. CFH 77786]|uniref:sigma-70 family RNA polymerase sigma factor n=1 Tax=Cohnella sp. CFH 77786 TaxID=2662265 RepID=UPI001C6095AB|nr:sigma-70 family RNA polymerase sigma factor [Cohnella sp. CFH 77786]MBW5447339.1 sigma-70 family RNA polymerase sigma factor [Cohnella sp. CFH 77786]